MKTLPSEQLAVRDAEVTRKARDGARESFEHHVKTAKAETGDDAGRSTHADSGKAPTPQMDTRPTTPSVTANAVPLMPTDALFGSGSRIYPQGLAVVGYLSVLAAGTDGAVSRPVVLAGESAVARGTTMPPSFAAISGLVVEQGEAATTHATTAAGRVAATMDEGRDDAPESTSVASGMADLPAWLARRVSFAGKGTSMTLRLRDYRITDSGNGELVDQLLRFADAQGQSVGRVVVNGHEVWRRDVATHINEQGVTWHGS